MEQKADHREQILRLHEEIKWSRRLTTESKSIGDMIKLKSNRGLTTESNSVGQMATRRSPMDQMADHRGPTSSRRTFQETAEEMNQTRQ